MSSPRQRKELQNSLTKLAQSLPRGSDLKFKVHEDHVWLEIIYIPSEHRGQGTAVLAKFLSLADQAGLPTSLLADPSDAPGDPETFHLARWYSRFGFRFLSATEDGVAMERPVDTSKPSPLVIQQHVRRAKANDLSADEFSRVMSGEAVERRPVFLRG